MTVVSFRYTPEQALTRFERSRQRLLNDWSHMVVAFGPDDPAVEHELAATISAMEQFLTLGRRAPGGEHA